MRTFRNTAIAALTVLILGCGKDPAAQPEAPAPPADAAATAEPTGSLITEGCQALGRTIAYGEWFEQSCNNCLCEATGITCTKAVCDEETEPVRPINTGLDDAMRTELCDDPCGGIVEVWRNVEGQVGRFVFKGDLGQCSHVMHVVYDAQGKELWAASDKPVTAEVAKEIGDKRDAALAAHQKTATVGCPAKP